MICSSTGKRRALPGRTGTSRDGRSTVADEQLPRLRPLGSLRPPMKRSRRIQDRRDRGSARDDRLEESIRLSRNCCSPRRLPAAKKSMSPAWPI